MTPAEYKKMIGERIQKARKAKDWTLGQLHAQLGFHRTSSSLGNYEAGLRLPPPWEAQLLATALGVTASYLLCLDEESSVLSPEAKKLLRNWNALPENERFEVARKIEIQAVRYRKTVAPEEIKAPVSVKTEPKRRRALVTGKKA